MEKKKGNSGNKKTSSLSQKTFRTNKLKISEDTASHLLGGIIEKGISDKPLNKQTPAPKLTVLPFPVARHRSHGPHWDPIGSNKANNDDNADNEDDEEDNGFDVQPLTAFANPVNRKQKKGLDFSQWKALIPSHDSSASKETDENTSSLGKTGKQRKGVKEIKTADRRNISGGPYLVDEDVSVPEAMDVERDSNVCLPVNKTKEAMTSNSGVQSFDSVAGMELDESIELQCSENVEDSRSITTPVNYQHGVERMSTDDFVEAHWEKMDHGLLGVPKKRDKKSSAATKVFISRSNNVGNKQGSMSLESEIDAENCARLQSMLPDEIAQAQAEIIEKIDPTLLNMLKKRGLDKLKKEKCSNSVRDTDIVEQDKILNESHSIQDATASPQLLEGSYPSQSGQDDAVLKASGVAGSFLWNAWSERVEAVRELRFSLDGSVLHDFVPKSEAGDNSAQNKLVANNVGERDYLRTEGDPGAAGYTIKEAVSLTRSVFPGHRVLALNVLASVLDKALHNIYQNQVGHVLRYGNKVDKSTDWEAVWAYALGPEPELVLSLRMCLDDNHQSVVLACLKVVQCMLSCDLNEYFFDISEKVAIFGKDIFTAPVFRSKPEIDLGFLHGGYWKYSSKCSNILPPSEDIVDDGKCTIQDDIFIAGQDFTAGLVRMEILQRLLYLLETDPTAEIEDCIISILIAIARHSPTCTDAIMKCERLVQTVVHRFTMNNSAEVIPFKKKSVCLLKVLARSGKKNCVEFIKNGIFRTMTWHLYRPVTSFEQWVKLGRENCKLSSGLMVEQLHFWKVCVQYGFCVSYFPDIFPALCLWLNPPSVEKLIEHNVLSEFASISASVYLVLEALAVRLPNLYSQEHPECGDDMETWSWNHVSPMLDSALKWLAFKGNLYASNFSERHKGSGSQFLLQDLSLSPLWVYSAIMLLLARVLTRVIPEDRINLHGSGGRLPWLPEFVPKIGLELLKNGFLSSLYANDLEYGTTIAPGSSFIGELCHIRQQIEFETSLASVSCLHGLVQVVVSIDILIRLAKLGIPYPTTQGKDSSKDENVLEEGILQWSLVELRLALKIFVELVTTEWQVVQSIEIFGRGGPAPGVGIGWGASGGGFWSTTTVLLAQTDARLLVHLLKIFQMVSVSELPTDEEMNFAVHIVDSALGICLSAGPRDRVIVDNALDILVQVPVLKYLDLFTHRFLQSNGKMKLFVWEYKEEDYLHFSNILTSHFKNRWLGVKRKFKAIVGSTSSGSKTFKVDASLDTIPEELDPSNITSQDHCYISLAVEWAHQRLPLPMHWFLSSISTISGGNHSGLQSASKMLNFDQDPNALEVAKAGLFFLLGMEAMASVVSSKIPSPVRSVPLFWKLHSLSVTLLAGMGVLEEEKSKDVFEVLQEYYGLLLDEVLSNRSAKIVLEKNVKSLPESGKNCNVEILRFKSEVHESYSTFVEAFVEQFAAISYGDLLYGRQVAVYLHRCVEAPVRLAAWNSLFNARALELLPPLEKCLAKAEGYLEPVEDNEEILEAYVKSWTAGALDRAASRGSMAFTLVLHHLSSFIFVLHPSDKLVLRNKLVKSLLRDYSRQQQHEKLMLNLVRYSKRSTMLEQNGGSQLQPSDVEKKFEVLTEACEGNSSLLIAVEELKSSYAKI